MTTLVGKQERFSDALKELCELDYDAIEAYNLAIEKLENLEYKNNLSAFMEDHRRHTREITKILLEHNEEPVTKPDMKQWLTKGKVFMGNLVSEESILRAMLSNEIDTNTAYERLNNHPGKWPDADTMLMKGLEDERRHKQWIENVLNNFPLTNG